MKTNHYLIFFFRLIRFLLLVVILDVVIGNLLRYYYFRQSSGFQYRTTYAIDSTNADIIIFGSSRANHHYYPDSFESGLNMSYYNAGRDGNFIFYHFAVLKAILTRHKPKMVILDFVSEEFKKERYSYDRLSSLLPYYESHPEIRSVIELRSPFEKYKLLSRIYPFNSALFTIAAGNASFNKSRKKENEGYIPLTTVIGKTITASVISPATYEMDDVKIQYFKAFIKCCIAAKVRVYIVCSPYYNRAVKSDYSIINAKQIAHLYSVDFLDHSHDSTFYGQASLFADEIHLNDFGARKFSNEIVEEIKDGKGRLSRQ